MNENQVSVRELAPQIPVEPELQSILLQITESRARLQKYLKAIKDRGLFEIMNDNSGSVNDQLTNAIYGLSLLMSDWLAYKLIENK